MSVDRPTSARDAAMRILLEEVEPLIKRAEDVALILERTKEELSADLKTLGRRVEQFDGALSDAQTNVNKLGNVIAKAETLASSTLAQNRQGVPGAKAKGPIGAGQVLMICLAASLASAALVGGGLFWLGHDLVEQARIGKALQRAWPTMDEDTRKRVEQVIR